MSRRVFRTKSLPLNLQSLDRRDLPSAVLPFSDGFEASTLGANWAQSATNNGAVSVTTGNSPISGSRHVLVAPSASGINSRSELILHVDLSGVKNALFTFKEKEFNDLDHPMPATFTGTSNTDGVALSVDGTNWYRIVSLTGTASQNTTQTYTYNLGQIAANNGIELTGDTMIKFQNYSNQAAPNGGFAFDDVNITISGSVSGKFYQDANADGVYQVGETLSAGHTVYLDSNNDGRMTVGSETAVFTEQLPAPILDSTRSLYPLHVYTSGNPTVGDVDVTIALAHTFTGDLDISLIAPDGRRVLLSSDNGGSGDNYFVTKFDDDAATSITAGSAPFNGTFRPEGKLSDMVGAPIQGWWYLEIVDDTASDVGTLGGWSLDLSRVYKSVVNQPISESAVLYSTIQIPDPYYDDMDVVVNIDHPNVGDLSILLATPLNDWVYLAKNNGGSGNNFVNTRFDDEASVDIANGSAPFTGHFRPNQKISKLEDLGVVFGQYELRVADDVAGLTGTLKDFSIVLTETFTAGADPVLAGNPGYSDRYADFTVDHIDGPILDVDALVYVEHGNDAALNLELSNVDSNTKVTLTNGLSFGGASGKNFFNTRFDDEALLEVIGDTGPYTGSYRPAEALTEFDGMDANGEWRIKVDNTKLASGQLNWAALIFRTADVRTNFTAQLIPDQTTITSNLTVAGFTGNIADLNVQVNINHTYDGDLDVYLTAPNGKKVELFTDVGAGGDNFSGTILDDEATTLISNGVVPFSGSFRPEGSLADFDGIDPNGTWTLTITDDAQNDSGLLGGWSLIVTTGERFDVTDAKGEYSFDNIAPGNITLRVNDNTGIDWTNPDTGKYSESIAYGTTLTGRDFGYMVDNSAPTANFQTFPSIYLNAPASSINLIFNEPVTGVDSADFALFFGNTTVSLAGATVTTDDNITWTINNLAALNALNGQYHIVLNSVGTGIMDKAMNPMSSFSNPTLYWSVDTVAPVITSLVRVDPAVNNLGQVSWDYAFSEGVYGLSVSNFELTGTAAAGAQIVSLAGGYVYADVFNNGTLGIKLANSTGAADAAGNPISNIPFTGETYTIARPVTQVTSVKVNDGAAQRSQVKSLTVTFNQIPDFAVSPGAAFALKRQGDNATVGLNADWNGNTVTLTFASGPLQNGSLNDGRYDLTVFKSQVANLDGNQDGMAGEDYSFNLHRLFGDADGNGAVTSSDFAEFRKVFGTGGPSIFDYDGDLGVNSNDFAEFRKRFGLSV